MKLGRNAAFSLIELMIVILIMGVLLSVAIPSYRSYVIRAEATEALQLAMGVQLASNEYFMLNGRWPNAEQIGWGTGMALDLQSRHLRNPKLQGGTTAEAKLSMPLAIEGVTGDLVLEWIPQDSFGQIAWKCQPSAGTTQAGNVRYLPSSCRV